MLVSGDQISIEEVSVNEKNLDSLNAPTWKKVCEVTAFGGLGIAFGVGAIASGLSGCIFTVYIANDLVFDGEIDPEMAATVGVSGFLCAVCTAIAVVCITKASSSMEIFKNS